MPPPRGRRWSQTAMSFDRGKNRPVDTATEEELLLHFGDEGARRRTDYLRTLATWGAFYREDQILVGFLEDVHFFPEELLRAVYAFLGVDPSFKPPGANSRVHARSTGSAPAGPMAHLARSYREDARLLEERFGGYASFWRFCADRLIGEPVDGRVARPAREGARRVGGRFGGYASFWRFCADRLIGEPLDGRVAYPLWGSPLWEE